MPKQGSLDLLKEPLAQELLQSAVPARLAYMWKDGTPRVVPIWFHWTGSEVLMISPELAPKARSLQDGSKVAIAIDYEAWPVRSLSIRGTLRIMPFEGVAPEYPTMVRKYLGEGADEWLAMYKQLAPKAHRLTVVPEWVGLIDLANGRLPSALEKAMNATTA